MAETRTFRVHGVSYIRTGQCLRCGECEKPTCPHFSWQEGLATCAIQQTKDAVCKYFPSHPFLRVIKEGLCGYSLTPATEEDRIKHQKLVEAWQ